jgi:tRNA modification GTPase
MDGSTIAAIATPVGSGGIGIIRISGPDALSIAGSIFCRSASSLASTVNSTENTDLVRLPSHRLYHGYIRDIEKRQVLDEVLLAVMKSPRSYTREDVVEIQAHSGPIALGTILDLVIKQGARIAEPGEFTKRAYLNGRIDLTQAEAVADVINARTKKSLEIATAQITGDMRACIESIRRALLQVLTEIEAAIDFPDEMEEIGETGPGMQMIQRNVIASIEALIDHYNTSHFLRDGLKIAVIGRPNVGKSSLMNRLIEKERVIVTAVPGTTRDLIEESLNIRGIPVILTDTAGLHETEDPVETIGIEKTHAYVNGADLILFMLDVSCPISDTDNQIYETIKNKPVILVLNKSDLVADDYKVELPAGWQELPCQSISALYNLGLTQLKELIATVSLGETLLGTDQQIVPNLRHKRALEQSLQVSQAALKGLQLQTPTELVAIEIRAAINFLDDILGLNTGEEVIDQIFSRFCIGK